MRASCPRLICKLNAEQLTRILLVDDDADTRDLIAFILEQSGAIVTSVSRATEALQVFRQTKFDLLISDIGMSDMDGYMLIQQIRTMPTELGGKVRAIALSAYAGEINQHQALAAGFQQHISKPVEPEKLLKAIMTFVGK
ncbi:response regulator [Nostoc commune]|uniref:response regulator n=1 Tax=Nostoc commune TaxID=1178 RepID=UPI002ED8AF20